MIVEYLRNQASRCMRLARVCFDLETARQLRLEIETLKSPKRIETLATRQLHLVAPSRDEAIVIERVVPADPPAASVVARR